MKYCKNTKAFTLIELIVTIAIIAILAAITIPSYFNLIEKSRNAVLDYNISAINSYCMVQKGLEEYDDEHFFTYQRNQNGGSQDYFSRFIEVEWEVLNGSGDADNSNSLNIVNQVSEKMGIVNWDNPISLSSVYKQQAMYLTTSSSASYAKGSTHSMNDCYKGSIVIWYDANYAENVYIYYVDQDGMQSDKHYIITRRET